MTQEIVMTAFVKDGKLKLRNRRQLDAWLKGRRNCEVIVTIEKAHATRSLAQNAYWHSVVVKTFAEHCGHTPKEMHEILKVELLPETREIVNSKTGESREITLGGSTAKLNKNEFAELIARAQQLGAEMGLYIPDPNEDSEAA